MQEIADAIAAWASSLPAAGSFIDVGAYDGETGSLTAGLAAAGWRGLCLEPAPDAAAKCAWTHRERSSVLVAALALTVEAAPIAPFFWTPARPDSTSDRQEASGLEGVVPIVVAQAHPSALFEFWRDGPDAAMPRPRFLTVGTGRTTLPLFEQLRMWTAADVLALRLEPGDRERARELLAEGIPPWNVVLETETHLLAALQPA